MSLLPLKVTALARTDAGGLNIIPNATVTILTSAGAFATLRESDETTPIANPFDCDDNGEREVYLSGGDYTVSVSGGQSWAIKLSGASDIQSVATIADLRALEPAVDDQQIRELSTDGVFYHDASDTTSADDGFFVVVTADNKRWMRTDYVNGSYVQNYLPPPKPSKESAMRRELENAYAGTILGGGYYGAGDLASDFVYETAINSEGGTNGAFVIRARYGLESPAFNKTGGDITVSVQMGANVAGVTCVLYSYASSDLPSAGVAARLTLVDGGGGLFTGTVTPSGAWSDFLAVQVQMTPVDSTSDETLHQETWVVKRAWMVQDAATIFDTNDTRSTDGAALAQIAVRVVGTTFFPEIVSYDGFDYLINHSRFTTGAKVSACWVAKDGGISTGYGSIDSPVTLARAGFLCALGMSSRFIFKDAGVYEYVGNRPSGIFAFTGTDVCLMAPNGDVELRVGKHIDMGSLTWDADGFYVDYDYSENYAATGIGSGASTPKLIRSGEVPLTEVLSESAVTATSNSFYWDLANSRFFVNVPDLSVQLIVPECDSIISATRAGSVIVIGVYADAAVGSYIKQLGGSPWCELYSAGIYGGTVTNSTFRHEGGNGFGVDCFSFGAGNDGYNYHDTGSFRLFDCTATTSIGDGVSPHEDCTLELIGGDYSNNVRAGVIPAYGANCIAFKVTANNNADGLNQYGNFMSLSDNSVNTYDGTAQERTKLTLIECITDGGDYGIVSRGVQAFVYEIDCNIDNQSIADIGSYDSVPPTGYGHVVTKDRKFSDIDYTEGDKISFVS